MGLKNDNRSLKTPKNGQNRDKSARKTTNVGRFKSMTYVEKRQIGFACRFSTFIIKCSI